MRVLVTGASGFIGAVLARRLLAEGLEVRGTWRSEPRPTDPPIDWRRVVQLDAATPWQEIIGGCEVVVHLAALAHQTGSAGFGRWTDFERVNVQGTRALAQASRAARVRRVILLSSVAALGARADATLDESSAGAPQDDYGRSKLASEHALQAELQGSEVDWCILRSPLVYGPGNPGNMARLLKLLGTGLPLPLGAIPNRRSFLFVDNLVDALVTVVRYRAPIRDTYLISDGSDFSTPELLCALAAASGRTVRLVRMPVALLKLMGRAGDVASRFLGSGAGIDSYSVERLIGSLTVNGEKFRTAFSWDPPVPVPVALARTCGAGRDPGPS